MGARNKSRRGSAAASGAAMQDGLGSDITEASVPEQPFTLQDIPLPWLQHLVVLLPRPSKLSLMQCSKLLAELVVQSSPTPPTLRLCLEKLSKANKHSNKGHRLASRLAQAAPTLRLVLDGRASGKLSGATSLPRGRITHLTLHKIAVTTEVLRGLQLQWWSQLSTIRLEDCSSDISAADINSLAQTRMAWLPSTFSVLDVGFAAEPSQALADVIQVLRPSTCKVWLKGHRGFFNPGLDFASLLRHVAHIKLYHGMSFNDMLKLPSLQHFTCSRPHVKKEHRQHPCRLQCLELLEGAGIVMLSHLPLGIQRVIVCGQLLGADDDDAVAEFVAGPPVVCAPWPADHWKARCDRNVNSPLVFTLYSPYNPAVISKVASSLSGHLHFDSYYKEGATLSPACLPSLTQLPAAVTRLCFAPMPDRNLPPHQLPERVQYWSELVHALPPHIRQLQLLWAEDGGQDAVALACALRVLKHGPVLLLDKGGKQLADACGQYVRVIEED